MYYYVMEQTTPKRAQYYVFKGCRSRGRVFRRWLPVRSEQAQPNPWTVEEESLPALWPDDIVAKVSVVCLQYNQS